MALTSAILPLPTNGGNVKPGGKLPTSEGGKSGEKVFGALVAGAPFASCCVTGAAAAVLGEAKGS